ncbi:MAG: SDR family oxidoreductase [Gemmatimonadaceae bacterium]|nr:SDR family oxidoreductase [Gloeobacterales cyanobacterium ES-bin-141]
MKAFVTGSTGLLGNNLVRLLHQQGHQVKALVRSKDKALIALGDVDVTWVVGDMRRVSDFAEQMEGCDVLFHTAAYFREYYQPGDHWQTLMEINVRGTIRLLEAAERRGVSKVIYVSSSGVIGQPSSGAPGNESTPAGPEAMRNLYFKSKVLAEQAVGEFSRGHALPVVQILPGWMFGPGDQAPTASGQLVMDFLARKLPAIPEGGACVVDARDVARAMIDAVERGQQGERYIVGGRYCSIETIAKFLETITGIASPKMRIPYVLSLGYAWLAENYARLTNGTTLMTVEGLMTLQAQTRVASERAVRELGATFRPLEDTLRDEVDWYRGQNR